MDSSENNSSWEYKSDSPAEGTDKPKSGSISWTASEYIGHEHGIAWFLTLIISTLGITALVYLVTKDYFATGTILVVGIICGIAANRKPHEITYEISNNGLKIGQKTYLYSSFKSFSVVKEESIESINLEPVKRFMPPVAAYFAPDQREDIMGALNEHLPYQEHKLDNIDRLARHLRF